MTETSTSRTAETPLLAGIRVLDFTHILAGPFCTRMLADMGADVVHVETRGRPDRLGATADQSGAQAEGGGGGRNAYVHRSKRSITIDLKSEGGRELTSRLASVADVIVENFSAGVMRRLGLDYERLQPLNGGLIYVSMSGYGHSGPRRDWTSMNSNLQAYSGLMMVTGAEGDLPTSISNSWNDFIGGLHACFGILQALAERARSGVGAYLDLAQFEGSVATLGPLLLSSAVNRREPPRLGNRSSHSAPQGVYRCAGKDEWCAIAVESDEQWLALTHVLGDPAWAQDQRLATVSGRLQAHDEIDQHLSAWALERTKEEVESLLRAAGVPAARMRRVDEVVNQPDSGHIFEPLEEAPGREVLVAGLPFSFERTRTVPPFRPAAMGEHTSAALTDWLGLTPSEIDQLETSGALR